MPEIPRSLGPSVRTAPLPAPLANPGMASPDAFGAAIGEGLGRGGVMALRARQEAEDDRDDIEAADALNQFAELDHQKMAEFRSRTGGNARGVLDEAGEDYRKRQEEFAKKLTRPGAQQRFREMTNARWANRNSAIITEHQTEQLRRYEADTLDGLIKTTQLDALDVGTDEALIEADRRAALTLQRRLDLEGADPQTRDLALRANRDALFSAAIDKDIDADNWKGAKARLDKFGDTMSQGKRTALEAKVREGGLNQMAQDTADEITNAADMTKADMDKAVASLTDADLRQRTQVKVDQEWSRREEALKIARGKVFGELAKAADEGADVEALIIKHEDKDALTQEDKDHLRGIAARRARRQEPPAGSPDYYKLRRAASVLPQQFITEDLNLWRGRIPESERQGLIELQADMLGRTTPGSKERKPSGLLTVSDIASRSLRSMGINGGIEKGQRDPRADAFERLFDMAIQAEGGTQNLTNAQMEAIANRLMAEETRTVAAGGVGKFINITGMGLPGMIAGIGIDGTEKVRAFEQPGADRRAFSINQVPDSYLQEASKARDKNGNPPTEQMILNAYNASLGQ